LRGRLYFFAADALQCRPHCSRHAAATPSEPERGRFDRRIAGKAVLETLLAISLVSLAAQLCSPSLHYWKNRPRAGRQVECLAEWVNSSEGPTRGVMAYLLYLPKNYHASTAPWPLVLALHGGGARGNDLRLVEEDGLANMAANGREFPFVLVSPQCPAGRSWSSEALLHLLDDVEQRFAIDKRRVYLTGYSMGGYGAWALAAKAPRRFAALAPLCGGGDPQTAKSLATIPIWAFHGELDSVVPLTESQEMIDAIKEFGKRSKISVLEGAEHGILSAVYEMPEFFEWMLSQCQAVDP
jgi:poly(3-hydroxybutyrate) depolymerase